MKHWNFIAGCFVVAIATCGLWTSKTANAVIVARAISADGDLNVTSYNHDADGDMFPNYDVDAPLGGTSTGPDVFNIGTPEAPSFGGGDTGIPSVAGDTFGIARQSPDPFGNPLNTGEEDDPNPGIAFALSDESLALFPGDTQGIIKSGDDGLTGGPAVPADSAPFFGVSDTVNGNGNDNQQATWTFDLSGATLPGGFTVSIDMAAMGDFESVDVFLFEVSTNGGSDYSPLFEPETDDEVDDFAYTLESGTEVLLDDPIVLGETTLNNNFQTFSTTVSGTPGSVLLRFSGITNGGGEAFAFRNVIIEDTFEGTTENADFNEDGTVNIADYTIWRDNLGGPGPAGDADGIDGVTIADYAIWKSQFGTNPGSLNTLTTGGSNVPEPTTLALLGLILTGAAFMRPRR